MDFFLKLKKNRKTKTQKRKRAILKGVMHTDKFILNSINYIRYRSKMMVKMLISRVIQNICPKCFIDELKIISKLIKFNSIKKGRGGGGEEKNNTVRMMIIIYISISWAC